MHIFYTPDVRTKQDGESYTLSEEESKHSIKVLRLGAGQEIALVDGAGGFYTASIVLPDPRRTVLKLLSSRKEYQKRNHYLHVAVAPTKNIERLEWFLEKATEIGIDEITPIICDRSERREVKTERLNKVIIAAMKQSLSAYAPRLNEPVKLSRFLENTASGQRFIAHCLDGERSELKEHVEPGQQYTVLIGPEGDFTATEIEAAIKREYIPVSLGKTRLRTETAALQACFEINYLNRP